ncbi:MAG: type II toxin-antitoxin system RelE family toxin [Mycobacteriales bacterium]
MVGQPSGVLRLRVGDHRVIHQVDDGILLVTVVRVAHRREVYRTLRAAGQVAGASTSAAGPAPPVIPGTRLGAAHR